MRIHLIRHTTPDISTDICYGHLDVGVCDSFADEVKQVQQKILPIYDILYTSPLKRCYQLSKHINATQRHTENALKEYNFGDWEGKPWNQMQGEQAQQWMNDFVHIASPNGESIRQMQTRVITFFEQLLEDANNHEYQSIALVTHAGVQRILFAYVMQIPLKNIFRLQLAFATVLEIKPKNQHFTISIL